MAGSSSALPWLVVVVPLQALWPVGSGPRLLLLTSPELQAARQRPPPAGACLLHSHVRSLPKRSLLASVAPPSYSNASEFPLGPRGLVWAGWSAHSHTFEVGAATRRRLLGGREAPVYLVQLAYAGGIDLSSFAAELQLGCT